MNIEWFTSPDTRNHCRNHNEFSLTPQRDLKFWEVMFATGGLSKSEELMMLIFQFKQQKQRPNVTKISKVTAILANQLGT
jgi:hypothetical protein